MLNLFIDTSYKYLTVIIEKDNNVLASYSEECFKRQSEELFVVLDNLFTKNNINREDIEALYLTTGPGSYTGVRIGMTLAKVLCQIKGIKLYTISTLKLYAGNKENTMVLMDARANRAYVGIYDKGKCIQEDRAIPIKDIEEKKYNIVLDGYLLNKDNIIPNFIECYLNCKNDFEEVKDINHLTPKYLKESDAYYR